jgi:hypothetical protein
VGGCTWISHPPKTYRLAQTGQVFYFAVSTQPGAARRLPGMPQPQQGMFGFGVANNINNTNNINFSSMPMCVGMHMDFPYIRNPQACTDWKGIYFAVWEPAPQSLEQLGMHRCAVLSI